MATRGRVSASESETSNTCAQHIEDCKVGAGDWFARNFELSKDFTLANYQIHQTAVVYALSTNERDEDDLDYGALIDRADQRDQLSQTVLSITTQSWT